MYNELDRQLNNKVDKWELQSVLEENEDLHKRICSLEEKISLLEARLNSLKHF